jgi:hypothetical protein
MDDDQERRLRPLLLVEGSSLHPRTRFRRPGLRLGAAQSRTPLYTAENK